MRSLKWHLTRPLFQHEDYDQGPGTYPQDIAVLHFAICVDLGNDLIDSIRIARAADGDFTGDIWQLSGCGTTEREL